jgi:membrane protease subunit (stomatin/prohibitin family)
MQVPNATSSFTSNANSAFSNGANGGAAPSFQSLLGQLTDYVKESPAQRMEAAILAQLGITPQQLADMSPADRQKVEDKVKEIMKKEIQAQQQQQQEQMQAQTQQLTSPSTTHSSSKHETTINLAI